MRWTKNVCNEFLFLNFISAAPNKNPFRGQLLN